MGYLCSVKRNLQIDNRTLVEECIRGDREAMSLFYTRFAPRMLGVIRRYVPERGDAEDILHDGFIVAFTRLDSLRDFDRVDYWLATIMKNLSLKFLNGQDVACVLHELPEVEDTPAMDDILDMAVLESLVRRLPEGYQKVFRLAVLENKSHNEIAGLLGIAPKTSSSQLFHARVMLRRLVSDYRRQAGLLSVLLLAALAGFMLLRGGDDDDAVVVSGNVTPVGVEADESTEVEVAPGMPSVTPGGTMARVQVVPPVVVVTDSVGAESESEAVVPAVPVDSVDVEVAPVRSDTDSVAGQGGEVHYAEEKAKVVLHRGPDGRWSLSAGVNPAMTFGLRPDIGRDTVTLPPPEPDDDDDETGEDTPQDGALSRTMSRESAPRYIDYDNVSHSHHSPVSFAVTVNRALTGRLGLETGLMYTYLHSDFETTTQHSVCHWHYLGVPVRLNYSIFTADRVRLYASLGAQVDIPLYSESVVTGAPGHLALRPGRFDAPVVWSVSAAWGVSVRLTGRTELFVEPTFRHHFKHTYEVPDTWADNPWDFTLPIGIRFNW